MSIQIPGMSVVVVSGTTNGSGAATFYSPDVQGFLHKIEFVASASGFADTSDYTITAEDSGESLYVEANVDATSAAVIRYPRTQTNKNTDGSGTGDYERALLFGERIKIVIAQGGSSKTGSVKFFLSDRLV